ncbi:hypothetical protein D3C72_2133580 [compost metagenome]
MQCLGPGIIDDQDLERFILGDAGQRFDFFQQAGGFQRSGQELLRTCAHGGQAGRSVGFMQAEEQQRDFLLQSFLGLRRQVQAQAGAVEVNVHDHRSWQVL